MGGELAGFEAEQVTAPFLPYSMSQGFTPPLFFMRLYLKLPFAWRFLDLLRLSGHENKG